MSDLPSDHVRTLLTAVELGTFDAAAKALHVTPSAVSQRVKALERRTGRVLLVRSKPVRPTESGEAVLRAARQMALVWADLGAAMGLDGGVPAPLAVAVNADALDTWFVDALARVPPAQLPPVQLHRADQDRTADLLRQGMVAAAVTSAGEAVAGCRVTALGALRYRACASPSLLRRHLGDAADDPRARRAALPDLPRVDFDPDDTLQVRAVRALHGTDPRGVRHLVPSSGAFVGAVVAGLGWGMIPDLQRRPDDAVVELVPGEVVDVPLFWQSWRLESPGLLALGDAVADAARAVLVQPG